MNKKILLTGKIGIGFLAVALLLQLAARIIPGFSTWYAHHIYSALVNTWGRFWGMFPFSVVELLLYLTILFVIGNVVGFIFHPLNAVCRLILLGGGLFFLYTVNCGIHYFAAPFSAYAGLETDRYSKEELEKLCGELIAEINQLAKEGAGDMGYKENADSWRREGVTAMTGLGEEFPGLGGFYPQPKEVAFSYILSVQQLCGIYAPFTIEANFNGDMPDYNIPHTLCHELSHLKGFMREDEANFIGYLACVNSDDPAFRYSGYLMGWVYAGNALARVDADSYRDLRSRLAPQAELDLQANNDFWDRYEGPVAEASNQINDTYLKINNQKDGVQSYGRMVDLMLAYRRQK